MKIFSSFSKQLGWSTLIRIPYWNRKRGIYQDPAKTDIIILVPTTERGAYWFCTKFVEVHDSSLFVILCYLPRSSPSMIYIT